MYPEKNPNIRPELQQFIDGEPELITGTPNQAATVVVTNLAHHFKHDTAMPLPQGLVDEHSMHLTQQELADIDSSNEPTLDDKLSARGLVTWRSDTGSAIGYALATTTDDEASRATFFKTNIADDTTEQLIAIEWNDTASLTIYDDVTELAKLDMYDLEILAALIQKSSNPNIDEYNDEEIIQTISEFLDFTEDPGPAEYAEIDDYYADGTLPDNIYQAKPAIERAARGMLRKFTANELGTIEIALEIDDSEDYICLYVKADRPHYRFDPNILEVRAVRQLLDSEPELADLNDVQHANNAPDEDYTELERDHRLWLRVMEEGTQMPVLDYKSIETEPEEYLGYQG